MSNPPYDPPHNPAQAWEEEGSLAQTRRRFSFDEIMAELAPPPNATGAGSDAKVGTLKVWNAGADKDRPIPPREWLLGNAFCRRYVSSVIAGGGTGKTVLRIAQALAVATGRPITGEHVFKRSSVLIISLEDDSDELRRRVRAAMIHHGIDWSDIDGRLFLAVRDGAGMKLATLENGKVKPGQLGPEIREWLKEHDAGLVIIDPLVKSHSLDENANAHLDYVAGILADIAAEHDIAIDAPHHVSKGTAEAGNADKGRGASAFKDAARLVYTLTTMPTEEANAFGVPLGDRRLYVRLDSAKVNISPPAASAKWFKLVGVHIGNGTPDYPHGDEVQTVEPWTPPDAWEGLSDHLANEILTTIDQGLPGGRRYSDAPNAKMTAAWQAVVQHVPGKTEAQARQVIKTWVKNGSLFVEEYDDPTTHKKAGGLKVNPAKRPG
jgi:hypothetical protein